MAINLVLFALPTCFFQAISCFPGVSPLLQYIVLLVLSDRARVGCFSWYSPEMGAKQKGGSSKPKGNTTEEVEETLQAVVCGRNCLDNTGGRNTAVPNVEYIKIMKSCADFFFSGKVLADTFETRFEPFTLEKPRVCTHHPGAKYVLPREVQELIHSHDCSVFYHWLIPLSLNILSSSWPMRALRMFFYTAALIQIN